MEMWLSWTFHMQHSKKSSSVQCTKKRLFFSASSWTSDQMEYYHILYILTKLGVCVRNFYFKEQLLVYMLTCICSILPSPWSDVNITLVVARSTWSKTVPNMASVSDTCNYRTQSSFLYLAQHKEPGLKLPNGPLEKITCTPPPPPPPQFPCSSLPCWGGGGRVMHHIKHHSIWGYHSQLAAFLIMNNDRRGRQLTNRVSNTWSQTGDGSKGDFVQDNDPNSPLTTIYYTLLGGA